MADILFEDIFAVKDIDSGGKKFLRGNFLFSRIVFIEIGVLVSRIFCESESFKMELILDVNTQIYPLGLGQCRFHSILDTIECHLHIHRHRRCEQIKQKWVRKTSQCTQIDWQFAFVLFLPYLYNLIRVEVRHEKRRSRNSKMGHKRRERSERERGTFAFKSVVRLKVMSIEAFDRSIGRLSWLSTRLSFISIK